MINLWPSVGINHEFSMLLGVDEMDDAYQDSAESEKQNHRRAASGLPSSQDADAHAEDSLGERLRKREEADERAAAAKPPPKPAPKKRAPAGGNLEERQEKLGDEDKSVASADDDTDSADRKRLTEFFNEHNPSKVSKVDQILAKRPTAADREKMWSDLKKKYLWSDLQRQVVVLPAQLSPRRCARTARSHEHFTVPLSAFFGHCPNAVASLSTPAPVCNLSSGADRLLLAHS